MSMHSRGSQCTVMAVSVKLATSNPLGGADAGGMIYTNKELIDKKVLQEKEVWNEYVYTAFTCFWSRDHHLFTRYPSSIVHCKHSDSVGAKLLQSGHSKRVLSGCLSVKSVNKVRTSSVLLRAHCSDVVHFILAHSRLGAPG